MPGTTPRTFSFRADVEGLRAVAVGLVLVSHAFGWLPGGALGVDVFFVISGFVITRGLVREWEATGGIDLRAFYRRRAHRILPLAAIVLATTTGLAAAVWFLPRALQVTLDAAASTTFVMNWHLIGTHASYAHADGPASPLQHFWSLAVEEQFYVVWPALAVLAWVIASRRNSIARRWLLGAIVFLGASSIVFCAFLTATDPSRAYFDSGTRAWELLAGCGAAIVLERVTSATTRLVAIIATWGGLLLILVASCTVPIASGFPWPGAVFPVVGAVLILLFGRDVATPLTMRPVRYAGRISFGLYLWHWPLLVLAEAAVPWPSPWSAIAALALSFLLAATTHRFVEAPVLSRGHRPPRRRRARGLRSLRSLWLPGVAALIVTALAASQLRFGVRLSDPVVLLQSLGATAYPSEGVQALSGAQLRQAVDRAAGGRSWPVAVRAQLEGGYR
ncbi:MAG: O-antigen acetylase, partial [Frondihabitans sp.]|nr:O-antigen acetylase [Frondihabitans sp.]